MKTFRNDLIFLISRLCPRKKENSNNPLPCMQYRIEQLVEKNETLSLEFVGNFEKFVTHPNGTVSSELSVEGTVVYFPKVIQTKKNGKFSLFPELYRGEGNFDHSNYSTILYEEWGGDGSWESSVKNFPMEFTYKMSRMSIFEFWNKTYILFCKIFNKNIQ